MPSYEWSEFTVPETCKRDLPSFTHSIKYVAYKLLTNVQSELHIINRVGHHMETIHFNYLDSS